MIRAVPIGFKERLVDPFYLSQNLGASGPSETAGRATTLAHVSRSRSLPISFTSGDCGEDPGTLSVP
jgi:hypothetical protein